MAYSFDWSSIPPAMPLFARGMGLTLELTAVATVAGIAWGTVLALLRLSGSRVLSAFATAYIGVFRAVPLVMVLLWFFLLIPNLIGGLLGLPAGSDLRLHSALVAFSMFEAAYYAEIIRAGIKSVPRGQMAAALALGLRYGQAMRLIVLPQAFRAMVPLLLTQAIVLFQDTSLVYVSALTDFFGTASIVGERDGRLVEMLIFAGAVYFSISYLASLLVRRLRPVLR